MKSSIVPAQITTIEDKVAGNLSLSQLVLLAVPVFIGSAVYIVFPPVMTASIIKLVVMCLLVVGFGVLAIRIKGRLLLMWLITIAGYNLRPRYHVSDKNDAYLRDISVEAASSEVAAPVIDSSKDRSLVPRLSTRETVLLEEIIASPVAKLHFITDRKGALRVRITQSK